MIDCGATGLFLDTPFVERHRITTFLLRNPISLLNIDGSPNNAGKITHFARLLLTIDGYSEWNDFLITNLGGENLILGLPWLALGFPWLVIEPPWLVLGLPWRRSRVP